jgi:NADPH2:quinone reductase
LLAVDGVASGYASAQRDARIEVPFLPLMRAGNVIRTVLVYVMPEAAKDAAVRDTTAALAAGALEPVIQRVYPLDQIAAAHEAQDDHPIGKLLIALA